MRFFILFISLMLLFVSGAYATHNRAGEITYEHISGLRYRIKITTYTKASSTGADRNYLKIRWGDEPSNVSGDQLDSLVRTNNGGLGIILPDYDDLKKNEYVGEHTYSGPGTFIIEMEDPNRNEGVLNIATGPEGASVSVMAFFSLRTELVIRPGNIGPNNSAFLERPPVQNACIYQPWIHNPIAIDPDGDELRYSLVPCGGEGGEPLANWMSPDAYTVDPNDTFEIDPTTGDISWLTPLEAGEYNIAIKVQEYRNGLYMGSVVRDMQITVRNCNNTPPVIQALADRCVVANGSLSFTVVASDNAPNAGIQSLIAQGAPLTAVANVASFPPPTIMGTPVSGLFSWQPKCQEVRLEPYQVSFIATDIGSPPSNINTLTTFETVRIRVVAPRVENPQAEAIGNQIHLNWNPTICQNIFSATDAAKVKYLIYRRNHQYGYVPDECELGVPEYTGYTHIGETMGVASTSFIDTDVNYGGIYCYMVVTVWPDGSESYASEEFCDTVKKEVPVMTKVSINITDITSGTDSIGWSKPSQLDTSVFTGPYTYRLYYGEGNTTPSELIYETPSFSNLENGDSLYLHQGLNTMEFSHKYRVEIYSQSLDATVGSSSSAASVFLNLTPGDRRITLSLQHEVPWDNYEYTIFRKGSNESSFSEIGTSSHNTYIDSALVNNENYCYKVKVFGSYGVDDVPPVLVNWSQEACAIPFDNEPPCPPIVSLNDDCENISVELSWFLPTMDCNADDISAYRIYYSPTEEGEMTLLSTIENRNQSVYLHEPDEKPFSIAGCYAITAVDSLSLWPDGKLHQNESELSTVICIDNCPAYELPNIFTPNGDGNNDVLKPILHRYVESVDFQVFNRWGNVVFTTDDPSINWNGIHKDSSELCPDGIYYYVVQVNFIKLSGIESENRNGYIRLADGKKGQHN